MGEARTLAGKASDQSQELRKEVIEKGTKRGKDISFRCADGRLPPQELSVGTAVPKVQEVVWCFEVML